MGEEEEVEEPYEARDKGNAIANEGYVYHRGPKSSAVEVLPQSSRPW